MRKKVLSMLLIATLTMTAFAGCGSKEKKNADATITPTETATEVPEATQDPTATIQPEATKAPEVTVKPEELDAAGSVDDLTYKNTLIGFSVTVPENWLMKGSEDTYDYLVNVTGMASDVDSFKSSLAAQGVNYLCYGIDTQISELGGTNNILAQSMLGTMFGGMDVETIIASLSAMIQQQYVSLGATCTVEEPVKFTVDEQEVYQVTATATMTNDAEGNPINQVVRQEYVIFMRNDILVYMAISTAEEDSAALAQQFVDSLSFQ